MAAKNWISSLCGKMHRRQVLMSDQLKTPLKRCLTVLELTFLGLSLMISGIFLTIPTVVSLYAGPSVIFSFLLAGIAAVLSAFAYAEMGSRVPRAGSGYVYVSVSLGEFWGFLAGWNMILEYALTCAAMSRSFSSTLFVTILEPNRTFDLSVDVVILGERTDIIAACVVIFFTIIVASGVRLASVLNSIMNFSALTLVFCVCVVCFIYGDVDNWVGHGASTFFPHGFSGIVKGGAICYFSYIGFECITVSSEETLKPHRSIPLAIVLVFIVATIQYVTSSLAFTYFTPTSQFDLDRPLASLFHKKAFVVTGIVIGIAGILAVCTNIMVALYSMSRVCYAMASDGLLCKPFSYINSKTQTPIYGMAFSGIFVALMTYIFELHTLVEAVSVGTLVSYILVGIGVIVLRFEPGNMTSELPLMSSTNPIQDLMKLTEGEVYKAEPGTRKAWVKDSRFFNQFWPDVRPKVALGVMVMFMTLFALTEAVALRLDMLTWAWNTALAIPLAIVIIVSLSHLFLYEQNVPEEGTFRVPLMPLIPALSIQMNLIFIMMLSYITWIRLVVWVAIGLIIYFSYGCRHSINKEDTYLLSEPTSTEYYGTDQTSDKIPKIISSYKGKELENELPAQDQGKKVEPHSKDKDVS